MNANDVGVVGKLMDEGMHSASEIARQSVKRIGTRIHPSTVTRWMHRGLRHANGQVIKLEFARLSGRLCTSWQAIQRFVERQQPVGTEPAAEFRSLSERSRDNDRAETELELMGVR